MPAGSNFDKLLSKYETLKKAWASKKLDDCGKLLNELKVALTEITLLEITQGPSANEKELLVAREVLEIGAMHSVAVKDVASFERYLSILKTYYTDHAGVLPESTRTYELLGLNLLYLLSQNRLAEFHTELEVLPEDTLISNPYIASPVRLEQFIMEGSYNKVIEIKHNVPAESYKFFIDELLKTIRDEIASCMEKAYEVMEVNECKKMLNLESGEFDKYINDRGWTRDKKSSKVRFQSEDKKQLHEMEIPSKELAAMAISYAKEMEKIV